MASRPTPYSSRYVIAADIEIHTPGGLVLAKSADFGRLEWHARSKTREVHATLKLPLPKLKPGDYQLLMTLRDQGSPKTATVTLPFSDRPVDRPWPCGFAPGLRRPRDGVLFSRRRKGCAATALTRAITFAFKSPALLALTANECQTAWNRDPTRVASYEEEEGNPMKFRPLHDRVVVRRVESEEKTAGGIIIPDTAKEKPQEGEIIAVGPGARDEAGKLVPLDVKAGDRILFGKWSGTEVKIDGEELLIMKESDVMGVIEGKAATRKAA